jgi:very-short-patch-repair endonuclease
MSRLAGISLTRSEIAESDVTTIADLPVTAPVRTIADLGRRLPQVEAVAVVDMALHARLVSVADLRCWASVHKRHRGVARLVRAIEWSDGRAESPMETRLRMLLVLRGLPKPDIQRSLYDETGGFVARPDLCYPNVGLAIEYDGGTHRLSLTADNRRQNRLFEAGYRILRFTAGDVLHRPATVVGQVERALYSMGSPN